MTPDKAAADVSRQTKLTPERIRNLVFEKTGRRLETDDPVFAIVALSDIVLDQHIQRYEALAARLENLPAAKAQAVPKQKPSKADAFKQETTWPSRWGRLAVIAAVSAVIGAGVARLMPMAYSGQAADLALASAVKSQIAQEGGNGVMWRTLRPEVQHAALAAMGR